MGPRWAKIPPRWANIGQDGPKMSQKLKLQRTAKTHVFLGSAAGVAGLLSASQKLKPLHGCHGHVGLNAPGRISIYLYLPLSLNMWDCYRNLWESPFANGYSIVESTYRLDGLNQPLSIDFGRSQQFSPANNVCLHDTVHHRWLDLRKSCFHGFHGFIAKNNVGLTQKNHKKTLLGVPAGNLT